MIVVGLPPFGGDYPVLYIAFALLRPHPDEEGN